MRKLGPRIIIMCGCVLPNLRMISPVGASILSTFVLARSRSSIVACKSFPADAMTSTVLRCAELSYIQAESVVDLDEIGTGSRNCLPPRRNCNCLPPLSSPREPKTAAEAIAAKVLHPLI